MPRIGRIHRQPHSLSRSEYSSSRHQPVNKTVKGAISHRFVQIHRKSNRSAYREEKAQISTFQGLTPVDHKHAHRVLLAAKSGRLTGEVTTGEVTAVPNPMPDTGFRSLPTSTSVSSPSLTALPSPSAHLVPLSKTGLPSISSAFFTPSHSDSYLPIHTATLSYTGPGPSIAGAAEVPQTTSTHKLSIPIIVLLAVCSSLVFIGIFSLIKYHTRPTRRPRPKPSLPILDDPFGDDKRSVYLEDSPLFGGKEHISNGGPWAWSQYTQPGIVVTKAENAENTFGSSVIAQSLRPYDNLHSSRNVMGRSTYSGHGHTQSVPVTRSADSPFRASLQQVQSALTRTAKRISMASMSVYAASPRSFSGIGLAISRSPITGYTADGSDLLKRTEPKAALARSRSNFVAEEPMYRYSGRSSYEGSETSSPSFLPYTAPQPIHTVPQGRSRIKSSYYTPGSYPRVLNLSSDAKQPELLATGHVLPVRSPDLCRDRDTQASTYAMSLSSPVANQLVPSPQPTLYPDDSLSVVGSKRIQGIPNLKKKLSDKNRQPSLPVIATAMDASAALGSLMLVNFNGQTTRVNEKRTSKIGLDRPAAAAVGATETRTAVGGGASSNLLSTKTTKAPSKLAISKSDDKPPSIPLPAPLPSLAQMALEHSNPQAFADYRSPTYSIYGLYEHDRKSGVGY